MIVVGLIATDGTTGMIDASTTRSPSIALDGAMRVHDRPRVVGTAHRRRRDRVAVRSQVGGDRVCELVVPDRVAGQNFELEELSERRIAADPAGELHPFEHPARVAVLGQEVAVDLGLLARVAAAEGDGSAGVGLDDGDAQRDRPAGRAVFGGIRCVTAMCMSSSSPRASAGRCPQQRADRRPHVERIRLQRVGVVVEGLVLEALPDGQIGHDLDAELRQVSRRADAGAQQDRRTPVCAAGEDHLTRQESQRRPR